MQGVDRAPRGGGCCGRGSGLRGVHVHVPAAVSLAGGGAALLPLPHQAGELGRLRQPLPACEQQWVAVTNCVQCPGDWHAS